MLPAVHGRSIFPTAGIWPMKNGRIRPIAKSMPERVTFFTFSILKFLPYVSFWNQCIIQVHFKVKTFSAFFSIFPTILVYFVFPCFSVSDCTFCRNFFCRFPWFCGTLLDIGKCSHFLQFPDYFSKGFYHHAVLSRPDGRADRVCVPECLPQIFSGGGPLFHAVYYK